LAKAISLTPDGGSDAAGLGTGAGRAARSDQDAPPLPVVRTEVHGAWAHGEVPNTKPRDADTKLTETGPKLPIAGVPDAPAEEAKIKGAPMTSATRMFLVVFMPYLTTVWFVGFPSRSWPWPRRGSLLGRMTADMVREAEMGARRRCRPLRRTI
jgi:hypothetical protein